MEERKEVGSYKVEKIILIESSFKRDRLIDFNAGSEISNNINIETEISDNNSEGKIIVTVIANLKAMQGDLNPFNISVSMSGIFEKVGDPTLPEPIFKKINAPAIIYPFIREHISNTCLKAGLGGIFLPPVNFSV